jgi:hypothetical protein
VNGVPVEFPLGEPGPFAVRVPGGVLEMHPGGLTCTRFPGLPPVDACPHDTDEYRARAASLGYGADLARMSRDHEATHSLLARWFELPWCPVLRGIAEGRHEAFVAGDEPIPELAGAVEAAVLAVQRYAMLAGVDLVKLAVEAAEREEPP